MTTALMAVAFYGDLEAVRYLLSLGAKTSLLDSAGKSAALFAGMRGHHDVYAELQRLDDGERDRGIARKGTGHSDFVYDLYCFERGASSTHADRTGDHAGECSESQSDAKRTSGDKVSYARSVRKYAHVPLGCRMPCSVTVSFGLRDPSSTACTGAFVLQVQSLGFLVITRRRRRSPLRTAYNTRFVPMNTYRMPVSIAVA